MSIIDKIKAYLPLLKGKIKPDYNLKSVFDIDLAKLKEQGKKGLFFDLDSTITISKSAKFSDMARDFIKKAEDLGFKLAIISNNYSKKYIDKVQKEIHIKIYYPAEKPQTKIIFQAMNELGLDSQNTVMIGDRPVTDILAGKNASMMTILVDGIDSANENPPTRLVRHIERLVIK